MTEQTMPPDDLEWLGRLARLDKKQRQFQQIHCGGKHKFNDYDTANQTVQRGRLQKKVHVYHCMNCHGWHVGNLVASREKRLIKDRRMQHEE